MDPNSPDSAHEMIRLVRENNQMLHAMRRSAFVGSIFKFIFYLILIVGPLWFYTTYMSASIDNLINLLNKAEGTTTTVQNNFSGLESAIKNIESHLPSFMQASSSTTTSQ
ncbi:MAG TPA: hypothetical protein VMU13_00015 [Candidatus Paceibacterota bacterium]|nr:hypothetical protein [Candidatus Paceibacterota bacterium]